MTSPIARATNTLAPSIPQLQSPTLPHPQQTAETKSSTFCGDSVEETLCAAFRQEGCTDQYDRFIQPQDISFLNKAVHEAVSILMGRPLLFLINTHAFVLTFEEVLQSFKGEHLAQATLDTASCVKLLGGKKIKEFLVTCHPSAKKFPCVEAFASHIHIALRYSNGSTNDLYKGLWSKLANRYLMEHHLFTIQYTNRQEATFKGFRGLLQHVMSMPFSQDQINTMWMDGNEGFNKTFLRPEKILIEARRLCTMPAHRLFAEMDLLLTTVIDDHKAEGVYAKAIQYVREFIPSDKPLRCRDAQENHFVLGCDKQIFGWTYHAPAMDVLPWLYGKPLSPLQGTVQDFYDAHCRVLRRNLEVGQNQSVVADYMMMRFLMTKGFRTRDWQPAAQASEVIKVLCAGSDDRAKAISNYIIEQFNTHVLEITIAFLFNFSTDLAKECTDEEIAEIWRRVVPTLQYFQEEFCVDLRNGILEGSLNIRTVSTLLEIRAFYSLHKSMQARASDPIQAYLVQHTGSWRLQLYIAGEIFDLPFHPVDAAKRLLEIHDSQAVAGLFVGDSTEPVCTDPSSPMTVEATSLNIDYNQIVECALQGAQSSSSFTRHYFHRLLMYGLERSSAQTLQTVLRALPSILSSEPVLDRRKSVVETLIKKLPRIVGDKSFANLIKTLHSLVQYPQNPAETFQKLFVPVYSTKSEHFVAFALSLWESFPPTLQKTAGMEAFHFLKKHSPSAACDLLKLGFAKKCWDKDWAASAICEMKFILLRKEQPQQEIHYRNRLIDLVGLHAKEYLKDSTATTLAVPILSALLHQEERTVAIQFAYACAEQKLSPVGPISDFFELLITEEKPALDKVRPCVAALGSLWLQQKEEIAELALHCLILLLRSLEPAKRHEVYSPFVHRTATDSPGLVVALIERLYPKGILLQRKVATLLLNCCQALRIQQKDHALALGRLAQRLQIWQRVDYDQMFDSFMPFYRTINDVDFKEVLRGQLLAVRPKHVELNLEMRRKRVEELVALLAEAYTPSHFDLLFELLNLADPHADRSKVMQSAEGCLPLSWEESVTERLVLLKNLQDQYVEISLEESLTTFPIATAATHDLVSYSAILKGGIISKILQPLGILVGQRLIQMKQLSPAIQLLAAMRSEDDGLWLSCLTGVCASKVEPMLLQEAYEAAIRRPLKKIGEGSWKQCLAWFEVEKQIFSIVLQLLHSQNHAYNWREVIQNRLHAVQDVSSSINTRFKNRHFMAMQLLAYLEFLLPDPPERFATLFEAIDAARNCLTAELMGKFDASSLPQFDIKRIKCALLSQDLGTILKGLRLLETDLNDQETTLSKRTCQDLIVLALDAARPFLSESPDLLARMPTFALRFTSFGPKTTPVYADFLVSLCRVTSGPIPEVLNHGEKHLTAEQMSEVLRVNVEYIIKRRKSLEEPIEGSGVALIEKYFSRLTPELKLKCYAQALEHLLLLLTSSVSTLAVASNRFPLLKMALESDDRELSFKLLQLCIEKCLNHKAQDENAQRRIMHLLFELLPLMLKHPSQHLKWMLWMGDFVFHFNVYNFPAYAPEHYQMSQKLIQQVGQHPERFLERSNHALVRIQFTAFLELGSLPHELQKVDRMDPFLERIYRVPGLQEFYRARDLIYMSCQKVFPHRSPLFSKWYGRLIDNLAQYTQSWKTMQLACEVLKDCSKKNDKIVDDYHASCKAVSREKWFELIKLSAALLEEYPMPVPQKGDAFSSHKLYTLCWIYLNNLGLDLHNKDTAQKLTQAQKLLIPHLETWKNRSLEYEEQQPEDNQKYFSLCLGLRKMLAGMTPGVRLEHQAILRRIWEDISAVLITQLQTYPDDKINKKPMTTELQHLFTPGSAWTESLIERSLNFVDAGREILPADVYSSMRQSILEVHQRGSSQ